MSDRWNKVQNGFVKQVDTSGTIGTSAVEIDISPSIAALRVTNVNQEMNKPILVSFDGGTKYKKVPFSFQREFFINSHTLHIKGEVADTDYEIEYLQRI